MGRKSATGDASRRSAHGFCRSPKPPDSPGGLSVCLSSSADLRTRVLCVLVVPSWGFCSLTFNDFPCIAPQPTPSDVKKAYMKTVRVIHPDKINSASASLEEALLAQILFTTLSSMYEKYRERHSL